MTVFSVGTSRVRSRSRSDARDLGAKRLEKLARRVVEIGVCRRTWLLLPRGFPTTDGEGVSNLPHLIRKRKGTYPLTMLRTSNRTPRLIKAYACTISIALPISLLAFLLNSFLLTGKFSNNFSTLTVVPLDLETRLEPMRNSPAEVKERAVPSGRVGEVQVVMERVATPQRDESASPRNPRVETLARSSKEVNLDVWCLSAARRQGARQFRLPLGGASYSQTLT